MARATVHGVIALAALEGLVRRIAQESVVVETANELFDVGHRIGEPPAVLHIARGQCEVDIDGAWRTAIGRQVPTALAIDGVVARTAREDFDRVARRCSACATAQQFVVKSRAAHIVDARESVSPQSQITVR